MPKVTRPDGSELELPELTPTPTSSNIRGFVLHEDVLYIRFLNGVTYSYRGDMAKVHARALENALGHPEAVNPPVSVGSYVARNIRADKSLQVEKVGTILDPPQRVSSAAREV